MTVECHKFILLIDYLRERISPRGTVLFSRDNSRGVDEVDVLQQLAGSCRRLQYKQNNTKAAAKRERGRWEKKLIEDEGRTKQAKKGGKKRVSSTTNI